jgi:ribonuclease HI
MPEIIIFTDGSHIKPQNLCGYGIHFPNAEFEDIGKPFTKEPRTNQRAELYAIYKAIKIVTKHDNTLDIKIYTDSEYSIKSLTIWIKNWKENNWISSTKKPVMNQDIIKKIDKLMEEHTGKIKFHHVRAHTGKTDFESVHNDITDKLAKQGANLS